MGLNLKNALEILRDLVESTVTKTRKITDFSRGSAIRTLFESIALTLEKFYFHVQSSIEWAIEHSILSAFGFKKREAVSARGTVTITFDRPLEHEMYIKKGTVFSTSTDSANTLYFETVEDYLAVIGSEEVNVTVVCQTSGLVGNVSSGAINKMVNPIRQIASIENRMPFTSGAKEETKSERKQRFARYIESLAKGTVAAIEYGSKELEDITGVWVEEEPGLVRVYAHDSSGGLTEETRRKLEEHLINYRAAGIPVEVNSVVSVDIELEVNITVLEAYNTFEYKKELENAIKTFVNTHTVGKDFFISDLIQFIKNYDTLLIVNCSVLTPETDVDIPNYEVVKTEDVVVNLFSWR